MRIFNLAEEQEKERKKNKEQAIKTAEIIHNHKLAVQELQKRIDLAIEYIKESYNFPRGCGVEPLEEMYGERIIDILKGSDNNE